MLWWFLENTIIAGLLAAIVWVACRVIRPSPTAQHALWLVVLVKLITPPLIDWPWSIPNWELAWSPRIHAKDFAIGAAPVEHTRNVTAQDRTDRHADPAGGPALQEFARRLDEVDQGHSGFVEILSPVFDAEEMRDSTVAASIEIEHVSVIPLLQGADRTSLSYVVHRVELLAVSLWFLGTLLTIAIHGMQVLQFQWMVAGSGLPPLGLRRRVRWLSAMIGVRAPHISVAPQARSPVIWGGFRTRLVWPAVLANDFESGRWDGVIAHELAHLRRGDHWIGWIELLAGCVHWWNPLFWYVRYRVRENAELACDAMVVSALPDGRRRYAASLIEVVAHLSRVSAPVPVLGAHSVARQTLERRLTMILSERVPTKLSVAGLVAISLLATAALPGWSHAQVPAATQSQAAEAKTATTPVVPPVPESADAVQVPAAVFQPASASTLAPAPSGYTAVVAATPFAQSADESRIDTLEKQLQSLIDEVKALRTNRSIVTRGRTVLSQGSATKSGSTPLASDVQTLSRATYRLPQAKAEALAAFLREHMKTPVEAKMDGENLVVTASPQAQSTIEQFIALSEGIAPPAQTYRVIASPARTEIYYEPAKQPAASPKPNADVKR